MPPLASSIPRRSPRFGALVLAAEKVQKTNGYESEAAFSRAFKRVAGESPGAWRKGARSGSG
jgi:hypothetical protein